MKVVKAQDIINTLKLIPENLRSMVKEVTMDLSNSMNLIVRCCFPKANRTIDRFHVQKLACDALQEMRIAHRWDAIQEEADAMEEARHCGKNTALLHLLMEIQGSNYWPGVAICCSNHQKSGRKARSREHPYSSSYIRI